MGDTIRLRAVEGFRMLRNEAGVSDSDELKEMKQRRVKGARLLQSGAQRSCAPGQAAQSMQRSTTLVTAFWKQVELF
jgi:hypothetical protein